MHISIFRFLILLALFILNPLITELIAAPIVISQQVDGQHSTNISFPLQNGLCEYFLENTKNSASQLLIDSDLMAQTVFQIQKFLRTRKVFIQNKLKNDHLAIEVVMNSTTLELSFHSPDGFDLKPLESRLFSLKDFRLRISKLLVHRFQKEKLVLFIPINNNVLVSNDYWEIDFFPLEDTAEFIPYIDPIEIKITPDDAFKDLRPGDLVYVNNKEREFVSLSKTQHEIMKVKTYFPNNPHPIFEYVDVKEVAIVSGTSAGYRIDDVVTYVDPHDAYRRAGEYLVIGIYPYGPRKGMLLINDYGTFENGMHRPSITVRPRDVSSKGPLHNE